MLPCKSSFCGTTRLDPKVSKNSPERLIHLVNDLHETKIQLRTFWKVGCAAKKQQQPRTNTHEDAINHTAVPFLRNPWHQTTASSSLRTRTRTKMIILHLSNHALWITWKVSPRSQATIKRCSCSCSSCRSVSSSSSLRVCDSMGVHVQATSCNCCTCTYSCSNQ